MSDPLAMDLKNRVEGLAAEVATMARNYSRDLGALADHLDDLPLTPLYTLPTVSGAALELKVVEYQALVRGLHTIRESAPDLIGL